MLDQWDQRECFKEVVPRRAEREEILWVHSLDHFRRLAATRGKEYWSFTPDTYASGGSFYAALLAAGGIFEMIERVSSGELKNGFALVRPPGHHAERNRAMGFCLINNVALGARFARRALGVKRILIVDWDVHHGNGTQHCFEGDPSVLFFSIHQNLKFPGTGLFTDVGRGEGEGRNVNIPLSKGYGDSEYVAIFERLLKPVALEFEPELILVSAGFDTHKDDPMGGMRMTAEGFGALTRSVINMADRCCGGKLVLSLEGGYNLPALENSVKEVLKELSGLAASEVTELAAQANRKKMKYAQERCLHVHRQYWKQLRDLKV
jgi:acetoin utilization deacetylase AcuC-like enzyme